MSSSSPPSPAVSSATTAPDPPLLPSSAPAPPSLSSSSAPAPTSSNPSNSKSPLEQLVSDSASSFKMPNTGWSAAAAGAVGGSLTALLLQPLDVIKTRQQQPLPEYFRSALVIRHIELTEGWRGFFRGSIPAVLRVAPGAGLYFWGLQTLQQNYSSIAESSGGIFDPKAEAPPGLYNAGSSGLCRCIAAVICAPLLCIKTRVESSMSYRENPAIRGRIYRALKYTLKTEGIRGLYIGLIPSLCRDLPFSTTYFMSYIYLLQIAGYNSPFTVVESKKLYEDDYDPIYHDLDKEEEEIDDDNEYIDDMKSGTIGMGAWEEAHDSGPEVIHPLKNFLIASLAGALASVLTHPFDVIRARMQLVGYSPSPEQTTSVVLHSDGRSKAKAIVEGKGKSIPQIAFGRGPVKSAQPFMHIVTSKNTPYNTSVPLASNLATKEPLPSSSSASQESLKAARARWDNRLFRVYEGNKSIDIPTSNNNTTELTKEGRIIQKKKQKNNLQQLPSFTRISNVSTKVTKCPKRHS